MKILCTRFIVFLADTISTVCHSAACPTFTFLCMKALITWFCNPTFYLIKDLENRCLRMYSITSIFYCTEIGTIAPMTFFADMISIFINFCWAPRNTIRKRAVNTRMIFLIIVNERKHATGVRWRPANSWAFLCSAISTFLKDSRIGKNRLRWKLHLHMFIKLYTYKNKNI